ncbi:NADAR family protein [Sabulibacter ruber]|uniref:NADAR family protein n=1 Tax=Sabulibacter ruber TaxID=2811901 RepID=UPI001A968259|nr:NADAR family protein [Sabulibacter ruber]
MEYHLDWLLEKYEAGDSLKYIFFWGQKGAINQPVGKHCFSQWYVAPFKVDGIEYKTTEHWMMAHKALLFEDVETYESIISCASPGEAKELGRMVKNFDQEVWEENRFEIVKEGNLHKFSQHPALKEYLLSTKSRILVEASPVDFIWGIGLPKDYGQIENPYHWRGLNLLGFALMEVRNFSLS